ncbi:MAG: alkaline phosphatase [Alistipes sp.]|nr:alkaline phosphatase [Alistipes sp.]
MNSRHLLRLAAATLAAALIVASSGCDTKPEAATEPVVENIILMVGDGMGLAQVTSLMVSKNYSPINMERATVGGFVKTYSANSRVTDSAAAGTAFSTGVKTRNGSLGVDPDGVAVETILEKAEKAGRPTGLAVTTYIQHATPGAFYTHNPDRNDYEGIAIDLVSSGVDVAIGGGRNFMVGRKADSRDLMAEMRGKGYVVADDLAGLAGVVSGSAVALYDGEIEYVAAGRDPMFLANATSKALEILTANSAAAGRGFFAMIEGSRIDHASHGNSSEGMIGEVLDFDNAVGVAFDYADAHPGTLVIVLADHETGGLTLASGRDDSAIPGSGVELKWSTGGHTGSMIPLFAYGAGAENFGGVLENVEVNRRMVELLGLD